MPLGRKAKANPNDPTMKIEGKKKKKMILNNVSGYVKPGQFLAIIGPSGSGKTSLLNLLAGRTSKGKIEGDIQINGQPWSPSLIRKVSGYVLQDDILHSHLTVKETLTFIAKLRLRNTTSREREDLVNSMIEELGLKKAQNTLIGDHVTRGVSGGERKRVNIGVEILTAPNIVFLDEPTSGLDSFTALSIIETLITLARANYAVVCTIHQPRYNIFELFDMLMVLSMGQVVYFGTAANAVTYFSGLNWACPTYYNPPDYFLDIITVDYRTPDETKRSLGRIAELIEAYKGSPLAIENDKTLEDISHTGKLETPERPSFLQALGVLYSRACRNAWRQKPMTTIRFVQGFVMGIILGLTFLNLGHSQIDIRNRGGLSFFLLLNQLAGVFFTIFNLFPPEMVIFHKERKAGYYTTLPYYLAKTFTELPITMIPPILTLLITYWMADLRHQASAFFIFLLFLELTTWCCEGLGLTLSIGLPKQAALPVAGVIIILLNIFGGYFLNSGNTPKYFIWLEYLSPMRYAFQAIAISQFEDVPFRCKPSQFINNGTVTLCPITNGNQFLDSLEFSPNDALIGRNFGILFGMCIFLRVVAYFLLRFVPEREQ